MSLSVPIDTMPLYSDSLSWPEHHLKLSVSNSNQRRFVFFPPTISRNFDSIFSVFFAACRSPAIVPSCGHTSMDKLLDFTSIFSFATSPAKSEILTRFACRSIVSTRLSSNAFGPYMAITDFLLSLLRTDASPPLVSSVARNSSNSLSNLWLA